MGFRGMEFRGRRVRVRPTAESSDVTRQRADEYGEIVIQTGTIQEGVRSIQVRLDSGEWLLLSLAEVEILN
jgi:hypothetical protein